jgi:RNA polymerase sigma-70 factor, ECF subfamily
VAAISPQQREVQTLFLKYSARLYGFICALYPDAHEAEDLLHEVFLVALEKADDFQIGTDFLAWTRRIARLKVLEHLRQRRKASPGTLSEDTLDRLAGASDAFFDPWDSHRDALRRCIRNLTEKARRMVEMKYAEARQIAEIAGAIGWTPQAVKVGLLRARTALRECVSSQMRRA